MRYGCETLPHFFDPAIEEQEEWEAQRFATVTNGLSYRTNNPNGRGVIVAYDRSKGRAFIHDASRNRLRTLLIVLSLGLIAGLCSIVYLGWARSQGVVGTDSAVRYEMERARKAASFDPDIQANRNDEWEERMKETKASSD